MGGFVAEAGEIGRQLLEDGGGLLGAAGGGLIGGVLGIAGLFVRHRMRREERQQDREDMRLRHEHERAMRDADQLETALQARMRITELRHEDQLAQTEGEYQGLTASIEHETALAGRPGVSQWVEDLRAATRPLLTFGAVAVTLAIWLCAMVASQIAGWSTTGTPYLMTAHALEWSSLLSTTAVFWWFGSRPDRSTAPTGGILTAPAYVQTERPQVDAVDQAAPEESLEDTLESIRAAVRQAQTEVAAGHDAQRATSERDQ